MTDVELSEDILERIRAHCLALPEVTVRVDRSLTDAQIDRTLLRHPA